MPLARQKYLYDGDGWMVRVESPPGDGPFPVMLMLHGWTGDENAMSIFNSRMPRSDMLLAPRGPYPTPLGGYGWYSHQVGAWPWVDDFIPALDALLELCTPQRFPQADWSNMRLVGFSQGAALAFTFALRYPQRARALAGLSGFLPEGAAPLAAGLPLKDKPVFLAHGRQDELVPVERARQAVEILEQAGATVSYCEHDAGHKLNADCFRGLQSFLRSLPVR